MERAEVDLTSYYSDSYRMGKLDKSKQGESLTQNESVLSVPFIYDMFNIAQTLI